MRVLFLFVLLYCCVTTFAQNTETDSLKKLLAITEESEKRVNILEGLSYAYLSAYPDTAMRYALEGLQLSKKINSRKGEAICTNALGNVYFHVGDNAKALELYFEYLKIKEEIKSWNNIAVAYYNIAGVYTEEKDYAHALPYLFKAKHEDEKAKDDTAILYDMYSLGSTYLRMQKTDSALYYINQSYAFSKKLDDKNMIGAILNIYGDAYFALNNTSLALKYYTQSIPYVQAVQDNEVLTSDYFGLAKVYKNNMPDSSIYYGHRALTIAQQAPFFKQVLEISTFLSNLFSAKKQYDSAFYYQQISITTKDSLFNVEEINKVQNLRFQEQQRQQAIEAAKVGFRNKIKLLTVIFISLVFLVIAVLLWRNNRQRKQANILLQQQKEKVEHTLTELKSAQAQLIQSEKMASLGQLTAGIAHEIRNPLNFVNNFSELNKELADELQNELKGVSTNDVITILNDIKNNHEKIIQHGKRADAIVQNMLQHSVKNTGVKEATDINVLCDEYLRISYRNFRAKDKSLNAVPVAIGIKTDFDNSIGMINIVAQDIGRALLNIFNNAFYAVRSSQPLKGSNYKPLVSVTTKKNKLPANDAQNFPLGTGGLGGIEITVSDNGNGIPQNIIDKIFQPFFTTKPTGQGTGLGLSLAYDIITKEHNGTIKAESKEGEGSVFIVSLPVV